MYLTCVIYRGAVNIGSMRMWHNESDVENYFKSGQARRDGLTWGARVYYFDGPGVPAKNVTKKFR